jgi:hypothetical protein
MVSRINVNRLASQILRPGQPAFLPPADEMQMHLATIDSHDAGRNEATVIRNAPGGQRLPRIPVLQTSGSPYVPQQGHVVQLLQIGNTVAVLGRQNRPPGVVTFL